MRRIWHLSFSLCLLVAGPAAAEPLSWLGTLDIDYGTTPLLSATGGGVATVNGSAGGSHLNTLRLGGGITGTGSATTGEASASPLAGIEVGATLGSGSFANLSGGPPGGGAVPVRGLMRFCIVLPGCSAFLDADLTAGSGATGFGVGGELDAGGNGPVRISFQHAPWTVGTATATTQTPGGGFASVTLMGFVHGPGSATSSTALTSGVVQLVTPTQVFTQGIAGQNEALAMFGVLTIHFVPEPGLLILLGSGVVGLVVLGRSRMQR